MKTYPSSHEYEKTHEHNFEYSTIQVEEPDDNGGMPMYQEVCECGVKGAVTL